MTGEDRFLEMGKRGAGVKEEEFDDLKEEWDSDDFPRADSAGRRAAKLNHLVLALGVMLRSPETADEGRMTVRVCAAIAAGIQDRGRRRGL